MFPVHKLYILFVLLLSAQYPIKAQTVFAENFENKVLGPPWNIVSGNWHIADVSELRIAPAENGLRYVLSADSSGYISLIIDIPDSIKARRVKLEFSYYIIPGSTRAGAEVEFHRRSMKDGIRGKPWKAALPAKGRWFIYKKIMTIPVGANAVYITFFAKRVASGVLKPVCIDDLKIIAYR